MQPNLESASRSPGPDQNGGRRQVQICCLFGRKTSSFAENHLHLICICIYISWEITTPKPPHIYLYISPHTEALYRCSLGCNIVVACPLNHVCGIKVILHDSLHHGSSEKQALLLWLFRSLAGRRFWVVISRSWLVTLTSVRLPSMDAEGAASGAPDDDAQLAEQPLEVAAASATVITEPLASTTEAPSADLEIKEEVDFSDPAEAAAPEVETVDLLGIEELVLQPTTTTSTPSIAVEEGAALSAPAETAEPSSQVVEGAGPSAPSRPPRTRGTRGGKDKQYQTVRRAYWQGFEQLKAWLESHSRPKSGRRGFNLQRVDFDRASGRFQELLVNWTFFVGRATAQQILCEVEFLVPEYADWVDHHGYNGEGGQLASHVRRKTPTIATLYAEADSNQVERTYSQLWEEAEARDWEEGHSHDPPVRRRVPVAKAQGAASSAPSGRSSSISGWVGRDFVPEEEAKGKGSKGKWIPKSTSETPAKASVPSPKTPEGPPPPHHPRQPKTPPPGRDPQVGKGTGSIPPPPSNPPTVFIPPRPKERPQSRPPVVRTPPVPPPPKSAQRPVENPSVSPTVTVKSTKVDPIQVGPDVTTPGVSASPDP